MTARARRRPRLTEAEWQVQVCQIAELRGWAWVHFPTVTTARKGRGGMLRYVHETPYQGPLGPGWVDLVLMRDRTLFVELKADGRYPEPHQRAMHDQARRAGCEVYVWRPRDLDEVVAVLSRHPSPEVA